MRKINVEFIFECLKNNTSKIRNIKKYMLAVLFNAPSTTDIYYTARVAHDMARGPLFGLTAHNDEYEDSDDDDKDNDDSVFDKVGNEEREREHGFDDDERDNGQDGDEDNEGDTAERNSDDENDSGDDDHDCGQYGGYDWVIESG